MKKQSLFYIQTRTLAKIAANGSGIFCIGGEGGEMADSLIIKTVPINKHNHVPESTHI